MPKGILSIPLDVGAQPNHQSAGRSLEPDLTTAASSSDAQQAKVKRLTDEGFDFYSDRHLEEAAECFRKALDLSADSLIALYNLGVVSGELGRYEESKASFERLVRSLEELGDAANPTTLASAHQGLGAALLGLWFSSGPKEPLASESEVEFHRAVTLDQSNFGAWVGLGIAVHFLGRLDDAETAFRQALEIDPDSQVATERLRGVLEDKLERRLYELGYLSKVNKPIRDFTPYENRTLIKVEGKPLSEIIVEERR